jgi:hypothetical protein
MEQHKYPREFPIAVKDKLRGILSNVDQPIQILYGKKRYVQVDPSVLSHQSNSVIIGFKRCKSLNLPGIGYIIYPFNGLLANIALDVRVVDHLDLETH